MDLDRLTRRRQRRIMLLAGVAILAAGILLGFLLVGLTNRADEQEQRADEAVAAAEQACAQLKALNYPCPFDPKQLKGDQGDAGPQGPAGPSGPAGRDGTNGFDGTAGPSGPPGPEGADGAVGPTGPAGSQGEPGPAGSAGADGKPPASFTWTDLLGRTYVCSRDSGSPDSAPTYTCTPTTRVR